MFLFQNYPWQHVFADTKIFTQWRAVLHELTEQGAKTGGFFPRRVNYPYPSVVVAYHESEATDVRHERAGEEEATKVCVLQWMSR